MRIEVEVHRHVGEMSITRRASLTTDLPLPIGEFSYTLAAMFEHLERATNKDAKQRDLQQSRLHDAASELAIKSWILSQSMIGAPLSETQIPPTGQELEAASRRLSGALVD